MYQYTAMAQEPDVNVDLLEEVQSMLRSSSSTRVRQAAERVSEYRPRVEERDQSPQNLRRRGEADNGASDYHFVLYCLGAAALFPVSSGYSASIPRDCTISNPTGAIQKLHGG
eukprot:gb/GECG01003274.1/.p1 GENE.gb/GECG01003274.1/~~gb/GECG01003274.1/.p1  ORF type:complete len:113 (+),score=14.82 gb/GECG01003274.1/:1-339(+)